MPACYSKNVSVLDRKPTKGFISSQVRNDPTISGRPFAVGIARAIARENATTPAASNFRCWHEGINPFSAASCASSKRCEGRGLAIKDSRAEQIPVVRLRIDSFVRTAS